MKESTRFASFLLILSIATVASGQGTTGALTGDVTHLSEPLPGVAVTVASSALQGTRTVYSYANGNYNLPALPPGKYTVTFEMEGMSRQTKAVTVGLARIERVDAAMQLLEVSEAITVTAAAPSVLETTEVQANYDADLVDKLPIARTIQAVTILSPGVRSGPHGGQIAIAGAPNHDTLYLVNGAVTNENLFGQSDSLFIEDAIQETSVLIGSISAEYGRFTGGVVSAITRSGGNEHSGSFRDSFTNPAWRSASAWGEPDAASTLDETYEATLGGRITRDRLWFFLAGRYAETHSERPYVASTTMQPVFGTEDERYEIKLTGRITPSQSLTASYLGIDINQTNWCPFGCWEESAIDPFRSIPRELTTIRYNGVLMRNGFVEAGFSARKAQSLSSGGDHLTTNFSDPLDIALGTAALDDFGVWGAPIFCGSCSGQVAKNENALLKGTYYLATKASGTHNMVAGYERFAESLRLNNYQSGSNFLIYSQNSPEREADGTLRPIVTDGDIIMYAPIPVLSKGSDFVTDSFYVNDKWDVGSRWSFNIGLRYDRNDGADSAGHPISHDSNSSPRIGAIHDLRGDGRFRVNASYSKYVSKIWEVPGGANGGGNNWYINYDYRGPTVGGLGTGLDSFDVLEETFRWFLAQGGTNASELVLEASIPGHNIRMNELDSPSVDEWTVGFGMQLGQKGLVRIDAVNRKWGDFYATFTSPGDTVENPVIAGEFLDILTFDNTQRLSRSYKGLLIQADYRPTGRIHAGGNYTWSRSRGNDDQGISFIDHASNPLVYAEYKDFAQFNPVGYITNDQTHRGRIWLAYDLPSGRFGKVNVSILESYESGRPYSAQESISIRPYVTNPGYATPPQKVVYFFSDRGEYRWDAATSTDLALNYELPIQKTSVFVQGEVLNVFDEQAQVNGNTAVKVVARFNPFTEEPIECPQGQSDCSGTNWQKGRNFGKPMAPGHYQAPRTYRFSAGLRF